MGKTNYGYEKRQKELGKQKKQEAKRQRKLDKKAAAASDTGEQPSSGNGIETAP